MFKSFNTAREFLRRTSPASHVTSFVVLHELTAVLPLPSIYYTLQATGLSVPVPEDSLKSAEEKMEKVLRRYGWLEEHASASEQQEQEHQHQQQVVNQGTRKSRMLLDMATSYAIVKVLLVPRIALSLYLTPWFARTMVIPLRNSMIRLVGKRK